MANDHQLEPTHDESETLFELLATEDVLAAADPQMGLTRRPDGQTTPDN